MSEEAPERPCEKSITDLIHKARQGSAQALGQLLENYRDYLLLVANAELDSDLRPKAAPSDLVQDTFLEAQRDFAAFRGEDREDLIRWLRGILRNNLADFVRRYRQTARRQVEHELSLDAGDPEEWENELSSDTASPELKFFAGEQQARLRQAIEQLPEEQRRVMALRHDQGRTWDEIAAEMDRSSGAVQKLWLRALKRLREQLRSK